MSERYPIEPFLAFTGYDVLSSRELAEQAGVAPVTVRSWRRTGVTSERADFLAVKVAGVMPYVIWPEWLDVGMALVRAEEERVREQWRKSAERRRKDETPEQRQRRLEQLAEYRKIDKGRPAYSKQYRASRTPEQIERARKRNREAMRARRAAAKVAL